MTIIPERIPRKLLLFLLSLLLYIASLFAEAIWVDQRGGVHGWALLLFGVFTATNIPAQATWFANLMLPGAWACNLAGARRPAIVMSAMAFALAVSFLFLWPSMPQVPMDEGGSVHPITGVMSGYWLWLASTAVALTAASLLPKESKQFG